MRILQCYRFLVGTKIPFDQWPGIIENFLQQQKLSHNFFHYCMETFVHTAPGEKTACERAAKENSFLGQIHIRETKPYTIQSLNNFTDASNMAKDQIYAILSKIYRRYGFAETSLIYRDIDFFSQRVPTPIPQSENLMIGYEGSGITLYRSCISRDSAIILNVECTDPHNVPDATAYADALGKLLPGVKCVSTTEIIMDAEEQAHYDKLRAQAKPLIAQAKDFFAQQMPETKGNDDPEEKVNISSYLKKMGKTYGYTYSGYRDHNYFMKKKLFNGHYICVEFASHPADPGADPYVKLCGLGFVHNIWADGFSPQNYKDASEYFAKLFRTLAEAEKTVFSAIEELYPPTPDWFVPT